MRNYRVFENGYLDENLAPKAENDLGSIVAEDIDRAFLVARASFPKAANLFLLDMGGIEGEEEAPTTERGSHESA